MVYFAPEHDPSISEKPFNLANKQTIINPNLECWDCTDKEDCPSGLILKGGVKAKCLICGESGIIEPELGLKIRRDYGCEPNGTIVQIHVVGCPDCSDKSLIISVKEVKKE